MRAAASATLVLVAAALLGSLAVAQGAPAADAGSPATPQDAGVDDAAPPSPPDPPPLVTRHQWIFDVRWRDAAVSVRGVRRVELAKPAPTARNMGRFAIELWVGRELVERVRFELPLLGGDELSGKKRPWNAPPSFERLLTTSAAILVPHSARATRAVLLDRATGQTVTIPWPPAETEAADAGPADGG